MRPCCLAAARCSGVRAIAYNRMLLGLNLRRSAEISLKLYVLPECLPAVLRHAGQTISELKITCEHDTVRVCDMKKIYPAEEVIAHRTCLKQRFNTSNCEPAPLITSSRLFKSHCLVWKKKEVYNSRDIKTKKHHMLEAEWQTSNKTTNRRQIFFSLS